MTLDDIAEIMSWGPIGELDPFRLSVRLQVMRIIFAIGVKALLLASSTAKLPASATATPSSKGCRRGSAPGCGTAPRPNSDVRGRTGPGTRGMVNFGP
jgi:hypothetical protein